jgi:hypothetical protein
MRAAGLLNILNVRNMGILVRYARMRKNTAIAAAIILQRNARAFRLRYISDAQPVKAENIYHGQQNTQRG